MHGTEYLRVVTLRKGKLKATEFRLRPGERGLSLFQRVRYVSPEDVVAAVRAAGKRGELGAAVVTAVDLRRLGLVIVPTRGETRVEEIDQLHAEARLPRWRTFLLRLRGLRPEEDFNNRLADRLLATARLL